jgi:exopolysaccharide biosynthesis protein
MQFQMNKDEVKKQCQNKKGRGIRAKIVFGVLSILLLISVSFADIYHQKTESQILGNGIEYFKRLSFDAAGWSQIHYYKVNLLSPDVNMKLLYNNVEGLNTRKRLSDLVTEKTVGAVNGDFFALTTPSTSLGLAIDQGQLLATPSQNAAYSSLVIENSIARIFKENILTELIHNGVSRIPIESYNRIHNQFYKIVVLDQKWGKKSIGVTTTFPNMLEIVIVGGVVQEIRDRMPAIDITEGMQVVIANNLNRNAFQNVRVGDSLVMNLALNLDPAAVSMGIGGGCRVIQGGVQVPFLQDLASRQPRTAIGIADGGQTLYMATFDGRGQGYKGMNGNELASFFIGLGCSDAMILDGGGSTTFFKKTLGEAAGSVINFLSDGTQRKIVTGLGIENIGVSGVLKEISVEPVYKPMVAVGSSIGFVVSAIDEAYHPYALMPNDVTYSVMAGAGTIKDGRFYPTSAGDAVIRVMASGKTADLLVTAYSDISRIAFETDKKEVKPNTTTEFKIYAYTSDGFKLLLAPQDLNWRDVYNLGTIYNGAFLSSAVGETVLEAQFLGLKAQINLHVGTDQVIYNEFEDNGISYTASSPSVTYSASYEGNVYSGNQALTIDYQFAPDAKNRALYMNFATPIQVESDVNRIGMYGYAMEPSPNLWIRLQGTDAKGADIVLDLKKGVDWSGWRYLEATVPANTAYPLSITKFYIVDVAPSVQQNGSIGFDRLLGLKKNTYKYYSSLTNSAFTDSQRGVNPTMGPIHAIVPSRASGKSLFDQMLIKQIKSKLAPYERVFVTGPLQKDLLPAIQNFFGYFNNAYSKELGDVTVVKFSNRLGGLRKTSPTSWLALNALTSSVKTPCVVMLLDENPFTTQGFYEPKELELFKEKLEAIALQGKEVVVIYEGSMNGSRLENDVRYISIKKLPSDLKADLKELRYLEWTLFNGKFFYEYKPLMTP